MRPRLRHRVSRPVAAEACPAPAPVRAPAAAHRASNAAAARAAVRRDATDPGGTALDPGVAARIDGRRGAGSSMPAGLVQRMSDAFGHDLSDVQLHTDSAADQLSTSLSARAFTVGSDVFFSRGSYDPASRSGQELIAHELTHVVQNRTGAAGPAGRVSHPDDAAEVEARRTAEQVVGGSTVPVGETVSVAPGPVLREDDELTDLQRLDAMLDAFDTPEGELITLVTAMSAGDKATVATGYREPIANALNIREMLQLVPALDMPLVSTLWWVQTAALLDRMIDYPEVQPFVVAASADERLGVLNDWGLDLFTSICTNATMVTAVVDLAFPLADQLRWVLDEGASWAQVRSVIAASPDLAPALADLSLLELLQAELTFDEFCMALELMGRTIPPQGVMLYDAAVQAGLSGAWADSDVALTSPPPAAPHPTAHEEGGWVYFDVVREAFTTGRVPRGKQASLPIEDPAPPDGMITVGGFHTHPNVGPGWGSPFFSGADEAWAARKGVPILMRGAYPDIASTSDHATGPDRLHLAGGTGAPGASGGRAPQAALDDELENAP